FFLPDASTTEIYTLSLHDALPISAETRFGRGTRDRTPRHVLSCDRASRRLLLAVRGPRHQRRPAQELHLLSHDLGAVALLDHARSEEHTSELQSQSNLVCRLLLEK